MSILSTEYLARISAVHPWRVLGVWAVVFVVAFVDHRRGLRRRP